VFFLDLVGREERLAFLDDSIRTTVELIAKHEAQREELEPGVGVWELRSREGALQELRARAEWPREIRKAATDEND